jgi:hypothetical protein
MISRRVSSSIRSSDDNISLALRLCLGMVKIGKLHLRKDFLRENWNKWVFWDLLPWKVVTSLWNCHSRLKNQRFMGGKQ